MSFPGLVSIWAAILELILLQQVLGLSADKKKNENLCGNRQMRGNMRRESFLNGNMLSISGNYLHK
jgi:hypothetical protein